ncbi:MAG: TRC40/GET3/ArsA family transport-energizing ATPase, partial [Sphaerochaetaceae bacterium]|nr:TRC40/GET3/ArsA family transport-energizing ATPase [Sphaerochaetaceae bacterium]
MSKYKIFIGKGGVGKSTCSSLCAVNLIPDYKKISLISMDPAHNLHDIFACELNRKPKKVFDNLWVNEADLPRKQREYIKTIKNTIAGVYHYQQSLNLEKYYSILKYAPGTEEYASLLVLEEQFNDKTFDFHVIDTPPTALTLKTLALPQVNLHWINALTDMRKEILDKKNTIAKIKKLNLAKIEDDQVYLRLQNMKKRYEKLNSLLSDTNITQIIVVLNEDELSLSETNLIKGQLDDLKLTISRIVINKSEDNKEWKTKVQNLFPDTFIESVPLQKSSIIGEE